MPAETRTPIFSSTFSFGDSPKIPKTTTQTDRTQTLLEANKTHIKTFLFLAPILKETRNVFYALKLLGMIKTPVQPLTMRGHFVPKSKFKTK
jgi:hypothetical protein